MVQNVNVVLVCDFCGAETPEVETKTITVNKNTSEAEACPKCWAKVGKTVSEFETKGRRIRATRRPRRAAAV